MSVFIVLRKFLLKKCLIISVRWTSVVSLFYKVYGALSGKCRGLILVDSKIQRACGLFINLAD